MMCMYIQQAMSYLSHNVEMYPPDPPAPPLPPHIYLSIQ